MSGVKPKADKRVDEDGAKISDLVFLLKEMKGQILSKTLTKQKPSDLY